MMNEYEQKALKELTHWQRLILQDTSSVNRHVKNWQQKINGVIPNKVHSIITSAFRQMIKAVVLGSKITTEKAWSEGSLKFREDAVRKKINLYSTTAAAEGGLTGFGGIFLGFADFPLLLGIKIKMLFEIASIYGFKTSDYKERLFILHILLLSFSSHDKRKEVYLKIDDWSNFSNRLPKDMQDLDWRIFQEEYRNYTDVMKLPQLIPIVGAPFGAVINYQLTHKLGKDAINAYRMRWNKLNYLD